MIQLIETESETARLQGPSLVTWLVANTEALAVAATKLDERAADLQPNVPRERVIELCQAVRDASLEITVALLALLYRSEDETVTSALAEASAKGARSNSRRRERVSSAPPVSIFDGRARAPKTLAISRQ